MPRIAWLVCAFVPVVLFAQSTGVREFQIQVDDRVLTDLHDRLDRTRFPNQIPASGWDDGSDTAHMRKFFRDLR